MGIGDRIRHARERKGMTQADLAHVLNTDGTKKPDGTESSKIDVVSISRWERGRMAPHVGTASRIAKALGVSIDWLVNGEEPRATGTEG